MDFYINKQIHEDRATNSRSVNDNNKTNSNSRVLFIGKVISVDDDLEAMRIQVRIPEFDNNILDKDLATCYPLHGQILRIFPQVGESVVIMLSDIKSPYNDRLWLSPVIRTYQNLKLDSTIEGNGFVGIQGYFEKNLKSFSPFTSNPEVEGILPDKKDISIIGRNNTDLVLSDNKIMLRCAYTKPDDNLSINTKNPGFILLNYNKTTKKTTNIVRADNVLLISHDGLPNFKSIMDEAEIEDAINKCHALPYGDILVNVLKLFAQTIINHIHPYPSKPPIKDENIRNISNFNYDSILSKNIKIN